MLDPHNLDSRQLKDILALMAALLHFEAKVIRRMGDVSTSSIRDLTTSAAIAVEGAAVKLECAVNNSEDPGPTQRHAPDPEQRH